MAIDPVGPGGIRPSLTASAAALPDPSLDEDADEASARSLAGPGTGQGGPGRALVPYAPPPPPVADGVRDVVDVSVPLALLEAHPEPPGDPPGAPDPRHLSPRGMAALSIELYADGLLTFEEYSTLAFQPELHPDFDRTIGALTGERAAPDRPKDFIDEWERRHAFELRHGPVNGEAATTSERIVAVLRAVGERTDVSV